jgi:segregation and condensation protein A
LDSENAAPIIPPAEVSDTYQVKLGIFEGPLDLLLFLIKKKQIDIHDIPIAVITREYLEYLERKEQINLDREGEFLLMAAYLIYIKSQMLLPREQPLIEAEDPRRALVQRLLDYQKIKAASGILREKEEERLQNWSRSFRPPLPEAEEIEIMEVSLFDLAECFFQLIKRRGSDDFKVLKGKEISLEEKMKEILDVLEGNDYIDFLEYLGNQETLGEALVSFFCLLELVKNKVVYAVQESLFHTIKVWLRREAPHFKESR